MFPYFAAPLYDPILGPKGPKEECFLDGGDKGDPLGIGPSGALGGLNATDCGRRVHHRRQAEGGDLERGMHLLAAVHDSPRRTAAERVRPLPDNRAEHRDDTYRFHPRPARRDGGHCVDETGGLQGTVRPSVFVGKWACRSSSQARGRWWWDRWKA